MKVTKQAAVIYDTFDSSLGRLYLIFSGHFLTAVSFRKPVDVSFKKGSAPKSFITELSAYFNGINSGFRQKVIFLNGTDFEKKVWSVLSGIPYGETRSYKWVAEEIGKPAAVRAVGQALSKNPVTIVVPCHRVIESDGAIGGYSSGVNIKKRLLEMEYYALINRRST